MRKKVKILFVLIMIIYLLTNYCFADAVGPDIRNKTTVLSNEKNGIVSDIISMTIQITIVIGIAIFALVMLRKGDDDVDDDDRSQDSGGDGNGE